MFEKKNLCSKRFQPFLSISIFSLHNIFWKNLFIMKSSNLPLEKLLWNQKKIKNNKKDNNRIVMKPNSVFRFDDEMWSSQSLAFPKYIITYSISSIAYFFSSIRFIPDTFFSIHSQIYLFFQSKSIVSKHVYGQKWTRNIGTHDRSTDNWCTIWKRKEKQKQVYLRACSNDEQLVNSDACKCYIKIGICCWCNKQKFLLKKISIYFVIVCLKNRLCWNGIFQTRMFHIAPFRHGLACQYIRVENRKSYHKCMPNRQIYSIMDVELCLLHFLQQF